ncbi:hypothetical protein N7495_005228 [Penicillium taxi]|uniref:uncharacterized protein n=1 Tax=Penicillium taxi TaxID=168475 RepID=UPI0025459771|nr:uncharacterized protein N7495_005228 [Penicillium taxi]KAJ5893537.1 hypothetical protein N7495_005228 [Penicillium taxi]
MASADALSGSSAVLGWYVPILRSLPPQPYARNMDPRQLHKSSRTRSEHFTGWSDGKSVCESHSARSHRILLLHLLSWHAYSCCENTQSVFFDAETDIK